MFLYIDPLKQGLKLIVYPIRILVAYVFIHRSIKTRIETGYEDILKNVTIPFLYIDPLKQGLKLTIKDYPVSLGRVFIHRSIKTRIETQGA